jgi:hypothetical protein
MFGAGRRSQHHRMDLSSPTAHRLARAKRAFTTRRVPAGALAGLVDEGMPQAGDLVLARVGELGQHQRIERTDGRRARIFPGDEIIVAFGNRYAPDQFEAEVPHDLGDCHLVAAGGVAARVLTAHESMDEPTVITPIGFVTDLSGRRLNLRRFALSTPAPSGSRPFTIAVVGSAMNSGKTTTAAHIILGLSRAGRTVAAAKVTGTGAGGDLWLFGDAGAAPVVDFTDAGLPTTYRLEPQAAEAVFATLTGHLAASDPDAIVLEVADGLFQAETRSLLVSPVFAAGVDAVVFAGNDALGATAGAAWLADLGLPVVAISGILTASPLATREAHTAGLPVLTIDELGDPSIGGRLFEAPVLAASA